MRKSSFLVLVGLVLLLVLPDLAGARQRSGSVTVTPLVGVYVFEGAQRLDTSGSYGLVVGYDFDRRIGVEGSFQYIATTPSDAPTVDVDVYSLRMDLLYHFFPNARLVPYLALGAGGLRLETAPVDVGYNSFQAAYGGGLKYFLNDSIALRVDARHIVDFGGRNIMDRGQVHGRALSNLSVAAGLTFQFGGQALPPAPLKEQKMASASAVADSQIARPAEAEAVVAPAPEVAPLPAPETEPIQTVSSAPASLPQISRVADVPTWPVGKVPPPGTLVQVAESPRDEPLFFLLSLEFASNSSRLAPRYNSALEKAGQLFRRFPGVTIRCEGYADSTGNSTYNLGLSLLRAESVCHYLQDHFDLDGKRLEVKAYGESDPVAGNDSPEGRQANRRVLIRTINP